MTKQTKDARYLIEEGTALRQRGEYRMAEKRFELAAALGDAEALYHAGENVKDVWKERGFTVCSAHEILLADAEYRQFDYYFRSAEGGYAPAMLKVAEYYRKGCSLFEANPSKAVYWYASALRNGMEEAREALADCYEIGAGVDKNSEIADQIRKGASNF